MLEIITAVAISAFLTVAFLWMARNRLSRQFEDIQRRLVDVERTAAALRKGIESSMTAAQLQRLHLGLVRLHEDVAERFGPLLPLAEKMAARGPDRDWLSDYQIGGLRDWASRLGVPLEAAQIGELAREIGQLEKDKGIRVPVVTHELLAIVIALLPLHDRSGLKIEVAGDSAPTLIPLLSGVVSGFLDQSQVYAVGNGVECDVRISDALEPRLDLLKKAGTLVTFGAAAIEELPAGLELVNAEWNVRVYRTSNL
jgi:hypothetical protein